LDLLVMYFYLLNWVGVLPRSVRYFPHDISKTDAAIITKHDMDWKCSGH